MTHEAWDVPARQAFRELETWSHRWRGIDGGDGARLAGMLARLMLRVVNPAKLASLRVALDALIRDRMAGNLDGEQLEQAAGNFVELLQRPPAPPAPPARARPKAPVVRAPWRCRWLGHAWRKGSVRLGGPVLYCARPGCVEVRNWPAPTSVPLPPGTLVGVALADVPAGAPVTLACGRRPTHGESEGCERPACHAGPCDFENESEREP